MSAFKPMLAADCKGDVSLLRFPLLASPKLDGVRCIILNGVALSRSLKPIPNASVQEWAKANGTALEAVDGELIVGSPTQQPGDSETVMARTMSGVMRASGEPDFTFHMFDGVPFGRSAIFEHRYKALTEVHAPRTQLVVHALILCPTQLDGYEASMLAAGYEGIMTRQPGGLYKQGRSTMKEQGLVKVKRFATYEAEVIGQQEMMHNENEATLDALGHTERGTSAAGLRPAGTLGALVCRRPDGIEFNIGTGFTAAQRADLWRAAVGTDAPGTPPLVGRTVTYRCFDYGSKDAPRFPVFVSFRSKEDMS